MQLFAVLHLVCVCVCVRVCVSVCVSTLYVYCMNTYSSPTKPHHGQCVTQLSVCVWSIIKTQQRSSHVGSGPLGDIIHVRV